MEELELLRTIRPIWLERSVVILTRGSSMREPVRMELEQFYNFLEQAVETGDPAWLDPVLLTWSQGLTQTDLQDTSSSLTRFVNEMLLLFFNISRETLDEIHSLQLISILLPIISYIYEKAAQFEIQVRVNFISQKLADVESSLEKLDRSKSDFIAVAAHELKTPLTLIEGYASMLRESVEHNHAHAQDTILLDGIQKGAVRLRGIIDDMIDVSLIDNDLMKLNFQPMWLNRLFSVLLEETRPILEERRLKMEISAFPGSSEMTFGDPERILQVFRNVVSNAIKFTPDGGNIYITGRKLPGFIEVVVEDTGIGIAPEDQPYIFEKFTQIGNASLHSSGKTKFKGGGPGLGLRIARGIIEAHGGAIWVESEGCDEEHCPGTLFHILLPCRETPPDDKMAKIFAPLTHSTP